MFRVRQLMFQSLLLSSLVILLMRSRTSLPLSLELI
ncbi:hypothetical protein LINPERHAP1_LOCUS22445 [Linum perenne]